MALRASSLQSTNTLAINREIGSQYDVILEVSKHLVEIDTLANEDINGLINSLNEAKDFTGITVVTGETPSWDAVNKVLTVTTEKGDIGADGRGIVDIELTSTVGLTKTYTINYTDATSSTFTVINGADGANGVAGKSVYQLWLDAGNVGNLNDFLEAMKGPKGSTGPQGIGIQGPAGVDGQDLTVEQIGYNGDGTFTWQFSDGTSYTTPDMRGPQGATGLPGVKGDTGQGVHHIKGTSTTNPNGDFGTSPFKDTYTLYGDAAETINLGHFTVANGVSDSMSMEVYDTNSNGIVDDSERLGGQLPDHYVNTMTSQDIAGDKTFNDSVIVQGNLVVNGIQTTVNSTKVTTADNQIVLNSGEVGNGVTSGKAGIAIDRGTATNYEIVFDESDDSFKIGEEGSLQKVATREDTPLGTGLAIWDESTSKFVTTLDPIVDSIQLSGGIGTQGTVSWNADEETLDIIQNGATLQVGQELQVHCRNNTASMITNGTVVMATGTLGASGRITIAPYDGTTDVKYVLGITTEAIAAGDDGKVTTFGKIRGINTSSWAEGSVLYTTTNGGLTSTVPTSGVKLAVAFVINSHTNNGTLMVRVNSVNERANAVTASKLETPRNIALTGDVIGNANFDGSGNISIAATIAANSVALGTDTTGNYVAGVTQGTGISVTGTAGEGWSPTVALTNVGTAGTYRSVTTDAQGRVIAGTNPTTVAGYGLTDVYTKTQVDTNIGTVAEFNAAINF